MNRSQNIISSNRTNAVPLLDVSRLSLTFRQFKKGLRESIVEAITDFNLTINEGEIVAVVGPSGTGKSLLADAILGILPDNAEVDGIISFKGEKLTRTRQIQLRGKQISLIPQSLKALDPLMKAGKQVQAVIPAKERRERQAIQQRIFKKLNLPVGTGKKLPFELSGGMARRVLIATAMASEAKLIIADEPTPGLDEETRQETIGHIEQLAGEGRGIMFITHDITTALQIADKVVVFYEGKTVEIANVEDFTGKGESLKHPYTKALWNALPENGFHLAEEEQIISNASLIKKSASGEDRLESIVKNGNCQAKPGETTE